MYIYYYKLYCILSYMIHVCKYTTENYNINFEFIKIFK